MADIKHYGRVSCGAGDFAEVREAWARGEPLAYLVLGAGNQRQGAALTVGGTRRLVEMLMEFLHDHGGAGDTGTDRCERR